MKPNIEDTDIIIRRVSNGWIVFSGSEYEVDHFMTTVYEEDETEWGEYEALISLFREHFFGFVQSKKTGGIKFEVQEKGYAFEEAEEDEEDKCFLSAEREFAALDDALEAKDKVIHPGYVHACDVCGRVVNEYETISCGTLSGVVMCAGKMKDSCKSPSCEKEDEGQI